MQIPPHLQKDNNKLYRHTVLPRSEPPTSPAREQKTMTNLTRSFQIIDKPFWVFEVVAPVGLSLPRQVEACGFVERMLVGTRYIVKQCVW